MSLSAATVWEVRSGASDSSGGGFVAGASGTDRSQSNTAFANGTNLTVDATTNTDVAPDGYSPVAADVGNLIQVTTTGGGAAFTTGFYQIASIQSGKWRLDRSPAATSSAGATWAMGGALASVSKLATAMAASNKAFVKSGTYVATAITFAQSGVTPSPTVPFTHLIGYASARGDITPLTANQSSRPQVLCSTLNGNVATFSNSGWKVENLVFGPSGVATCGRGISLGASGVLLNCKVSAFTTQGLLFSGTVAAAHFCEFTGGTAGSAVFLNATICSVIGCWIHDNAGIGINASADGGNIQRNLISNQTGAAADGISVNGVTPTIVGNTVYKCGRDGIRLIADSVGGLVVKGNLLSENIGYGIDSTVAAIPANFLLDGNAFYSNTLGARNNLDDTASNAVDGVSPYTNTLDVTLSADPFVAKGSNDFRLNTTAGGGAACRAAGSPGAFPGGTSTVGYLDLGAVQSQAVGGALLINPGFAGGFR